MPRSGFNRLADMPTSGTQGDTELRYIVSYGSVKAEGTYTALGGEVTNTLDVPYTIGPQPHARPVYYVPAMRGLSDVLVENLGSIELRNRKSELIEVMRLVEPELTDIISVQRQGVTEVYLRIGRSVLPLSLAGDGLKNVLTVISLILTGSQGTILVDEIENGIHHSLHVPIWCAIDSLVRKYDDTQIIATTHSFECISAAAEAAEAESMTDLFGLIRLDRTDSGTRASTYSWDQIATAVSHNLEVR